MNKLELMNLEEEPTKLRGLVECNYVMKMQNNDLIKLVKTCLNENKMHVDD
jgi:hypothetical protein